MNTNKITIKKEEIQNEVRGKGLRQYTYKGESFRMQYIGSGVWGLYRLTNDGSAYLLDTKFYSSYNRTTRGLHFDYLEQQNDELILEEYKFN